MVGTQEDWQTMSVIQHGDDLTIIEKVRLIKGIGVVQLIIVEQNNEVKSSNTLLFPEVTVVKKKTDDGYQLTYKSSGTLLMTGEEAI